MLNIIAIQGRLTHTPELKTTQSGISVARMSVAVERSYAANGERTTDFFDVVAWRKNAEFVCKYFTKGQMILINGELQTRGYEDKQGNKRKAFEILANNINFCGKKDGDSGNNSSSAPASAPNAEVEIDDFDDLPF